MGKPMLVGEMLIAVDFDGTITNEPDIGKIMTLQPEADRVIKRLHEDGIKLILWTCRSGPVLDDAIEFLKSYEIYDCFVAINDQMDEIKAMYEPHVARKVGADIYIDDKSLGFTVDWLEIEDALYGGI